MRTLLSIACVALPLSVASAQVPAFNMEPERDETISDPSIVPPAFGEPVETIEASDAVAQPAARRYLLEEPRLKLQGETAVSEWSFDLAPAQVSSPAELVLTYINSIVVAPETSQLSIEINNANLLEEAPQGAEGEQRRVVTVPAGLLVSGSNTIRVETRHRHRTDCTINSTFDLWTDISAENTYLAFEAPDANRMTSIMDIVAVGADTTGLTRFHIVAPSLGSADMAEIVLQLSQKLALASGSESLFFTFAEALPDAVEPGELVVVVGSTEEVSRLFDGQGPSNQAIRGGFVPLPEAGNAQAMVFSATDMRALKVVLDSLGPQDRVQNNTVPFVAPAGSTRFTLADLGVSASQFFGRRFVTSVKLGMPADFYASNYGVARVLLDAAYSSEVLPGGSFNVSVNGKLATTVPITTAGGAVLQKYPIRIPMRHFTSGINTIEFEALLPSEADNSCAPGATAANTPRFALFGTSELIIPTFARARRAPDLAAWAAFEDPPNADARPLDLSLTRYDDLTLSAAATVMGKLALSAGKQVDFKLVAPQGRAEGNNVIFIGAVDGLPADLLDGIALASAGNDANAIEQLDDANLEFWNERIRHRRFLSWFGNIGAWLKENFNLDLSAARFWPGNDNVFRLPSTTDAFFYQSIEPGTGAIRTVISASSDVQLANGAEAFARQANWSQIRGAVSYHDILTEAVVSIESQSARFLSLSPLTFTNLRLVLTNWFASHFLLYSFFLLVSAIAAGLATNTLLRKLGRDHEKNIQDAEQKRT